MGATGPAPEHGWSGYSLRFKNPNGTWGSYTNLRGAMGRGLLAMISSLRGRGPADREQESD